ncbi:MAG: cytidylate kinase-like family protein [Clostridia bacterium]|nr:cytidylate kinase-like family protein [Clostridia bacterium]
MKTIITIGRQYGSGGKEISKKLSEKLGIPFYDDEFAQGVAEAVNAHPDVVKKVDERATNSLLYTLVSGGGLRGISDVIQYEMHINDKVFVGQSNFIKETAKKGPCIFLGRCADYVLDGEKNLLRVFLYADMDSKIKRIGKLYDLDAKKAKEQIIKIEKQRKTHYNYYTDREWDDLSTYDLCINVGLLGIDNAVDLIIDCVNKMEAKDA